MLKEAHVYLHKAVGDWYPQLFESHNGHGSFDSSSLGLRGLAEQLSAAVHSSFGEDYRGEVCVKNFAPPGMDKYSEVYDLPRVQMRQFEKFLSEGIRVKWIRKRDDPRLN